MEIICQKYQIANSSCELGYYSLYCDNYKQVLDDYDLLAVNNILRNLPKNVNFFYSVILVFRYTRSRFCTNDKAEIIEMIENEIFNEYYKILQGTDTRIYEIIVEESKERIR